MKYILAVAMFIVVSSVVKKLFKKSYKSEELSLPENTGKQDENKNEKIPYIPLEQEKLEALFRKYNCNSDDILILELYEKKEKGEELTEDEMKVYMNPELKDFISMAEIFPSVMDEPKRAKEKAIRDLINGTYQKYSGNPVEEIINFTLTEFENEYKIDSNIADINLIESFPLMYKYIKFQIFKIPGLPPRPERPFDILDAFQEFIDFTVQLFTEKYPEKLNRDEEIRKHFRIHHHEMIRIIDEKLL